MWLLVALAAAMAATALHFLAKQLAKYKIGTLALMLWGAAVMIAIDKAIALPSGEPFIETATDGLVNDSLSLGITMVAAVIILWALFIALPNRKEEN